MHPDWLADRLVGLERRDSRHILIRTHNEFDGRDCTRPAVSSRPARNGVVCILYVCI